MDFGRIATFFRRKAEFAASRPPDPSVKFPNPKNLALFARLKEGARIDDDKQSNYQVDGYLVLSHPDLTGIMYDLIPESSVKKDYAYGRPVLVNSGGVIFAYASGTHYVFFRLDSDRIAAAQGDGGRLDPTYGGDWIEFRIHGRKGCKSDSHEAMRTWAKISYQDSMSVE
jgi:hypothetical protein